MRAESALKCSSTLNFSLVVLESLESKPAVNLLWLNRMLCWILKAKAVESFTWFQSEATTLSTSQRPSFWFLLMRSVRYPWNNTRGTRSMKGKCFLGFDRKVRS